MSSSSYALLFILCLWSASEWLLPEGVATVSPELVSLPAAMTIAFLSARLVARKGGNQTASTRPGSGWRLVISGIGTLGAPALLLLLGRQRLSSVMAVATQASIPVIVAVITGVTDAGSDLQRRLIPGLLGLTGVLLVLPVNLPHTEPGWVGLALYIFAACLSGVSAVFCHREMVPLQRSEATAVVTGANTVFLVAFAGIWLGVSGQWHRLSAIPAAQVLLSTTLTAISILGLLTLLRNAPPLAAASRFIMIPLIASVQAYVLLRPTLSFRSASGLFLMLAGGLACTRAELAEPAFADVSLS